MKLETVGTIFLILSLVLLSFTLYLSYTHFMQSDSYNFGNLEINKGDFDNLAEFGGQKFLLCGVDNQECVMVGRIE